MLINELELKYKNTGSVKCARRAYVKPNKLSSNQIVFHFEITIVL